MASTKSFEDVLIKVEKKLEDCFMRQIKVKECFTHMHQAFSLWSDKLFKSVEAAEKEKKSKLIQATVKEKKNQERQVHSYRLQGKVVLEEVCDHSLWDIIVNGDFQEETAPTGDQSGPSAPPVPKTAKQLAAKRNHESVKSILILAIPDEYLLKFHNVPDAKSL
ncbi:hypothetical protein Tco_0901752, partial [Tanacetum coccineum]